MADTSKNARQFQTSKQSNSKRNVKNQHVMKKRAPQKHNNQENAVYVTQNTNIKAYITKCEKLFDQNYNEIIIHCMGAAIQQGVNLALQLCEKNSHYQVAVNTSTIHLIDDFEPLTSQGDYETQRRANSALLIKVIKNVPAGTISQ